MVIFFSNNFSENFKEIVYNKFSFLVDYFDYEPGKIIIKVSKLEEFESLFEREKGYKPSGYTVGFAGKDGRVFILDKEDFPKKQHSKEEFENVVLHELAHIFIRRLTWPEHPYVWIEEGICEYLSFGKNLFNLNKKVDFEKIETIEGWKNYHPYKQVGLFFKFLSKKYGDKKIVFFITKLKENANRQKEFFAEVFDELKKTQDEFFAKYENVTPPSNTL